MTGASDGPSTVLDQATAENGRHAEACRNAGSLSAMLSDVARHESAMDGLMAQMAADRDHMRTEMQAGHCSEVGMDVMSQDLSNASDEVAVHAKQMRAAPTLGAGQFECSVHAHELGKMLDNMRNDVGSMSCTPQ